MVQRPFCSICTPHQTAEFERPGRGGTHPQGGPYCTKHALIFWGAHFAVDVHTRKVVPERVKMATPDPLDTVLQLITDERARQDAKWGVQNHPSVPAPGRWFVKHEWKPGSRLDGLIHTSQNARAECQLMEKEGTLTWLHIALEELAETADAPDDKVRLTEIIQTAAVMVAWAENIIQRGTP